MSQKEAISLLMVVGGVAVGCWLSIVLPPEKLTIAMTVPVSVIGAGLAKLKG